MHIYICFSRTFTSQLLDSGQAVVTGVVPSPRFLPSALLAHRVQQSRSSSIFHRVLLTHALALFASQFVLKKKYLRIYRSLLSAGLEITKLTYARLEDNLIRHGGDRSEYWVCCSRINSHDQVRGHRTGSSHFWS